MKKLVADNPQNWHKKLYEALRTDWITPKRAIGMALFELVYGVGAQVSLPLELSTTKLQSVIEDGFCQERVMYLNKLEEERDKLVDHITKHQMKLKQIFDMRAKPHNFLKGDEVLLWDRRETKEVHSKFDSLWKGQFVISETVGLNTFRLSYLDGTVLPFTYNGQDLKLMKM